MNLDSSSIDISEQKIQVFILKLLFHGELISIPRDLIIFCHVNFGINQPECITELIYTLNKILKPKYLNEIDEEKLRSILPGSLPDGFKQNLIKFLLKQNIDFNPNKELIPIITDVDCEPDPKTNGFRLNLKTLENITNLAHNIEKTNVSFTINQHQLQQFFYEMDEIRQQLFHSVKS